MRDRAIFVGEPEDIVPLSFGKDLPAMRDWVPKHFDFAGYIIGEHPGTFGSRADAAPNASVIVPTSAFASSPSAARASARI